ncbi:hypothetical protein V6Z11_A07G188800 [Gossypium hirsutum]
MVMDVMDLKWLDSSTPPTEYKFNVKNLGQSSTLPFHFFSRLNLSLSISFSHLELSSFFHSSSHFLPTSSQVPTKDFSIREGLPLWDSSAVHFSTKKTHKP